MAVAGAGPPSTRKGYAAAVSGKAANGGRRAAAPMGVLSIEDQMRKAEIQADFPTGPATAEREIRQVDKHQPLFDYAAGKSFLASASHSGAPPYRNPRTSFSLLDRARPVFSFSSGRKRENGGCNEPAIIMAEILPARQGEQKPPRPSGRNAPVRQACRRQDRETGPRQRLFPLHHGCAFVCSRITVPPLRASSPALMR